MVEWELIDDGSFNGVQKYLRGLEDGSVDVKHVFDPSVTKAIIEQNKAAANHGTKRFGELEKVAHIPPEVMYKWWDQYRINSWSPSEDDKKRINRLLDSNEWRYLKCKDIILGHY